MCIIFPKQSLQGNFITPSGSFQSRSRYWFIRQYFWNDQISELSSFRHFESLKFQISKVPHFQGFKYFHFQTSKSSNFANRQIIDVSNIQIPKFTFYLHVHSQPSKTQFEKFTGKQFRLLSRLTPPAYMHRTIVQNCTGAKKHVENEKKTRIEESRNEETRGTRNERSKSSANQGGGK